MPSDGPFIAQSCPWYKKVSTPNICGYYVVFPRLLHLKKSPAVAGLDMSRNITGPKLLLAFENFVVFYFLPPSVTHAVPQAFRE